MSSRETDMLPYTIVPNAPNPVSPAAFSDRIMPLQGSFDQVDNTGPTRDFGTVFPHAGEITVPLQMKSVPRWANSHRASIDVFHCADFETYRRDYGPKLEIDRCHAHR